MKIIRIWAMPNRWTFKIKPIKEILDRYVKDGKRWADPFAGKNSPAEFTNDMEISMPTKSHLDALDFLKSFKERSLNGVIYDPPYNPIQAKWCYKTNNKYKENTDFYRYMSHCRKQIAKIIQPNGYAICCGFNSGGIGKKYGFELKEVLLIPHGANRNDTIVTVEQKMNNILTGGNFTPSGVVELPLNPIPSHNDNKNNGSGTKPLNEGI